MLNAVISDFNFNSMHPDNLKSALKFIQLVTIPNLFPFKDVQKCQHCQLCVLRENSITGGFYSYVYLSLMILCQILPSMPWYFRRIAILYVTSEARRLQTFSIQGWRNFLRIVCFPTPPLGYFFQFSFLFFPVNLLHFHNYNSLGDKWGKSTCPAGATAITDRVLSHAFVRAISFSK